MYCSNALIRLMTKIIL